MNYIVIDLEWNQSPLGKGTGVRGLPFEIIEIGAIKLDDKKEIIDEFSRVIKPIVYTELHFKTKEIIHIPMEELIQGIPFEKAIREFFTWCGKDYIFCTWGGMDLTELQRNMEFYQITEYINKPIYFFDIQKLFCKKYVEDGSPKTLEYAVDYLNLKKEEVFHRAIFDAHYTALVLQEVEDSLLEENYSLDYFHNPKSKEEEITINYSDCIKYISCEFSKKEDLLLDRTIRTNNCFYCQKKLIKRLRWFANSPKTYLAIGECKEHGFMKAKIRVKHAYSGKLFSEKTIKPISEEEVSEILQRQAELKVKKKLKKKKIENNE